MAVLPCPYPGVRAVRLAIEARDAVTGLMAGWERQGIELPGLGVDIAKGYATLDRIGFESRYDYAAMGTNLGHSGPWRSRASTPQSARTTCCA